jgi:hypothetical protein
VILPGERASLHVILLACLQLAILGCCQLLALLLRIALAAGLACRRPKPKIF